MAEIEDLPVGTTKTNKKGPERSEPAAKTDQAPLLSFEEFALQAQLTAVRAEGFQVHLRATEGLAPRLLKDWQAAMTHYQVQA